MRQDGLELIEVLTGDADGTSQCRGDQVGLEQVEKGLRRLLDAGVFAVEGGDEDGLGAERVELGVHGALREGDHLELRQVVRHGLRAVLEYKGDGEFALDNGVKLGSTRMYVRCVETAGAKEPESDAGAGADESGELFAIRFDGRTALTLCYGGRRRVEEVVDEVGGLEQVYAVFFGGGEYEMRY